MPNHRIAQRPAGIAALALAAALFSVPALAQSGEHQTPQVGPRPAYLVEQLEDGPLKTQLQQCAGKPLKITDFSISHRGAPLQFPEHTREGYLAGALMGAGIMECDVTFTKDKELVCRHSQCDLHTSTDILARPELAAKCSEPFTPADPATGKKAEASCCTSDLALAEFRQLRGKMDGADTAATTVEAYMKATPDWRTDLYASTGTLMTLDESIQLFKQLGRKFTPELKAASVKMPFDGFTEDAYAQKMIDAFKSAGIDASQVYPQSFQLRDVLYWIKAEPAFGKQAILLDERDDTVPGFDGNKPETWGKPTMKELVDGGVKIIAPAMPMLVTLDANKNIVPSEFAKQAKAAGLDIITWSLERSGTLTDGGGYYYASIKDAVHGPGATYKLVDVLDKQVGVRGIFSDWPATVTYYASCMGK